MRKIGSEDRIVVRKPLGKIHLEIKETEEKYKYTCILRELR
jgi:hypothetical protein